MSVRLCVLGCDPFNSRRSLFQKHYAFHAVLLLFIFYYFLNDGIPEQNIFEYIHVLDELFLQILSI